MFQTGKEAGCLIASRAAVVVVKTATYLTGYSDYLTSFCEPLSSPHICHTGLNKCQAWSLDECHYERAIIKSVGVLVCYWLKMKKYVSLCFFPFKFVFLYTDLVKDLGKTLVKKMGRGDLKDLVLILQEDPPDHNSPYLEQFFWDALQQLASRHKGRFVIRSFRRLGKNQMTVLFFMQTVVIQRKGDFITLIRGTSSLL